MIRQLRVKTNSKTELVDITQGVQRLVTEAGSGQACAMSMCLTRRLALRSMRTRTRMWVAIS